MFRKIDNHITLPSANSYCSNSEILHRWPIVLIVIVTITAIAFSRGITLTYNMELHPDEPVFYLGTDSLLTSLVNPAVEFTELKEYPEGAYVFHLPIFALGRILQPYFGLQYNLRVLGRISSVCYFIAAVCLGIRILWKYLSKNYTAVVLYALTMIFSVFFIEQSRYGVGDMISVFLLLLVIDMTARSYDSGEYRPGYLLLASFFCGSLGAVKWPLLQFILIPMAMWMYGSRKKSKAGYLKFLLTFLLVFLVGFFIFSPKAATDWRYFLRASQREINVYVVDGKDYEAGGIANHIIQIILYTTLYSDFPLSIVFVSFYFVRLLAKKTKGFLKNTQEDPLVMLFSCILPATFVFFLVYNLFVKMMVFRTFSPFFAILALYAAHYLSELWKNYCKWKFVILLLSGFMLVRGSWLIYIMHDDQKVRNDLQEQILSSADAAWDKTLQIGSYIIPTDPDGLINPENLSFKSVDSFSEHGIELHQGELAIAGGYEFGLGSPYILPVDGHTANSRNEAWQIFKEVNEPYFRGQIYPDSYYYLFGGWIRGGTISTFTMPCTRVYYRSQVLSP